jgi:hypothetical protein
VSFNPSPRPAAPNLLTDASHKLSFMPEHKLLANEARQRGYTLLNQNLRDPNASLATGKIAGYAECYKLFTGKDLFDAGA